MNFEALKKDTKYHWTQHVVRKMIFYGLSPDRIKRVIRNPKRVEDGIAENTIAVMMPGSNKKKPTEIWVMYQAVRQRTADLKLKAESLMPVRKVIISAWRYPGVSPVGKQTKAPNKLGARPSTNNISALVPIPADILEELKNEGIIK